MMTACNRCAVVAVALVVTPPNAFDHIVVVDRMPDCGGNIQVSAVLPGRVTDYVQALA